MIQQYDMLEYDRTQTGAAAYYTDYKPQNFWWTRAKRDGFNHRKTKTCFRALGKKSSQKLHSMLQAQHKLSMHRSELGCKLMT